MENKQLLSDWINAKIKNLELDKNFYPMDISWLKADIEKFMEQSWSMGFEDGIKWERERQEVIKKEDLF